MITHDIRLVCKWATKAIVMHSSELVYDGSVRDLFLQDELLRKASLLEPPASTLAKKLTKNHLEQGIITIEQFKSEMRFVGEQAV